MSKTLIIIAVICVAAGFLLQFTGAINITELFSGLPTQVSDGLAQVTSDPFTFLKDNISWIAGSLTMIGVAYGALKSKFDGAKTSLENKVAEEQANRQQISTEYLKLDEQKKTLDTLLTQKDNEINKLKNEYGSSESTINKLTDQIRQLEKEKSELTGVINEYKDKLIVTPKPPPAL